VKRNDNQTAAGLQDALSSG